LVVEIEGGQPCGGHCHRAPHARYGVGCQAGPPDTRLAIGMLAVRTAVPRRVGDLAPKKTLEGCVWPE